jgi:DHA1 family bicyclomycin/chloramphenicol resistance-like MFS transporter
LSDRAFLLLLAAVITLGSIATNIYLPALPAVRAHFDAGVSEVQATFAVALITFAIGILVWGPISDRYGRRPAILSGMAIVVAGATICLTAQSLGWLVLGRAVQAFGTSVGIAVSRAIVSDKFPVDRMAPLLAKLAIVSVTANGLAPIVGGFLTAGFGWRSVFAALLVAATIGTWFVWRYLPETRSAQKVPPNAREMAQVAGQLVRKRLFMSCVLQTGAGYAVFLVFISLAPYVMISALHRPQTEFGLYYLFIALGYVLGNWCVGRFAGRGQHWLVVTGGAIQAAGAVAALLFVVAGLEHPIWIFAPIGVLFFGQGLFMPNMTAIAVSLAPQHAGVGSSTLGFLQQVIGAICVQLMAVYATDTALPLVLFCACASLLQLTVLWLSPRIEAGGTLSRRQPNHQR